MGKCIKGYTYCRAEVWGVSSPRPNRSIHVRGNGVAMKTQKTSWPTRVMNAVKKRHMMNAVKKGRLVGAHYSLSTITGH